MPAASKPDCYSQALWALWVAGWAHIPEAAAGSAVHSYAGGGARALDIGALGIGSCGIRLQLMHIVSFAVRHAQGVQVTQQGSYWPTAV